MEKKYEIVVLKEDLEEKYNLGIKYLLYRDKYLEVLKIFLDNCKKIRQNKEEGMNPYEKFPQGMSNIITIVGGRGSGKTTVLEEMCTIFSDFENKKKEWISRFGMPQREKLKEQVNQKFKFLVMDVIDASVLEEKDDLLEMILWHIYNDVKDKIDLSTREGQYSISEWERQKFLEVLDEVYRMHQSIKGKAAGNIKGESVVTALESMPNSIKTRKAMRKLLDLYFKIMFPEKEENAFLVISIDDFDLNIKKSYQMLEEICRYLLDVRIIVLIAVDNKQMEEVCITHFYEEFGLIRNGAVEEDLRKHILRLSNSYLIKLLTLQNRIYLSDEAFQAAQIAEEKNGNYRLLEVKQYLILNIAKKMHIFYDAYGLKKHFCEPDNIRGLISYIEFLESLHTVEWNAPEEEEEEKYLEQQLEYYNQNYMRFGQDIVERMAFQILQFEQHDIFGEIRKRDLERRTGYVIQWYKNFIHKRGFPRAIQEMEHFDFGEFLDCIYDWGRKDYEYKALVHCLLASFTTEMTKEYFNYRYNLVNLKSVEHSRRRLEGYVGDNISGGLLSEEMGSVFWREKVRRKKIKESKDSKDIKDNKESAQEDEYEVVNQENAKSISIEKEKELRYIQFEYCITNPRSEKKEEHYSRILNTFARENILPILECIFLCLDNYKRTKGGADCIPKIEIIREQKADIKEKRVKDSKINFTIQVQVAKYADFDILGFVKKSIDYHGWRASIGEQLIEAFKEQAAYISGYKLGMEGDSQKCNKAIDNFEKTSLFAENPCNEMALPLYNLDLSYNIFKRFRRNCRREFSMPVEINDVLERILQIYKLIEDELRHEEDQYKEFMRDEDKFMYRENFANDPYVKKFRELVSNETTKAKLLKHMKTLYLGSAKIDSLDQISPNLNM